MLGHSLHHVPQVLHALAKPGLGLNTEERGRRWSVRSIIIIVKEKRSASETLPSPPPFLPAAPHLFVAEAPALDFQEARNGPEDGDFLHQSVLHLHILQDFLVLGRRQGRREGGRESKGRAKKKRKELESITPHTRMHTYTHMHTHTHTDTQTDCTYLKGLALDDGVEELDGVHTASLLHCLEKGQLARRTHGVQDCRERQKRKRERIRKHHSGWVGARTCIIVSTFSESYTLLTAWHGCLDCLRVGLDLLAHLVPRLGHACLVGT